MKKFLPILLAFANMLPATTTQVESNAKRVDQILGSPGLRGVASVRVGSTIFIAVWVESPQAHALEIYGMKPSKYPDVQLVVELKDNGFPWQSITAVQDGAVAGFLVRRTAGEGWFGASVLYLYVEGRFKKVFESGSVADLLDLNGDGYPEVLEYQGDKADSGAKVKISVWKNDRYHYLATVPLTQLYSSKIKNRIDRFLQPTAGGSGTHH
jgi:hypothetical protein